MLVELWPNLVFSTEKFYFLSENSLTENEILCSTDYFPVFLNS